jgi:hypothetical protein
MPSEQGSLIVQAYYRLIKAMAPKTPQNVHAYDQNAAAFRNIAAEVDLDLSNEETLRNVTKAHALIAQWVLTHISECDDPVCRTNSLTHAQVAHGQLGYVLFELAAPLVKKEYE